MRIIKCFQLFLYFTNYHVLSLDVIRLIHFLLLLKTIAKKLIYGGWRLILFFRSEQPAREECKLLYGIVFIFLLLVYSMKQMKKFNLLFHEVKKKP